MAFFDYFTLTFNFSFTPLTITFRVELPFFKPFILRVELDFEERILTFLVLLYEFLTAYDLPLILTLAVLLSVTLSLLLLSFGLDLTVNLFVRTILLFSIAVILHVPFFRA